MVETREALTLSPLRGEPRDDIRPGLRVTHHNGRTLIAYAADEGTRIVSIVGVFYGGRNLESALSVDGQGELGWQAFDSTYFCDPAIRARAVSSLRCSPSQTASASTQSPEGRASSRECSPRSMNIA